MNSNGDLEFKPNADTELEAYAQQDLHISGIENKGYDDPQKAIDFALTDQDNIQKKNEVLRTKEKIDRLDSDNALIYNVSEAPPIYLSLFFGFQQALLSLSGCLSVSLIVAETVCAEQDEEFKAKLLASTLFMSGITTLLMTYFGVRLPLFQGAAADYVIPLLAMAAINEEKCIIDDKTLETARNHSILTNTTLDMVALNRDTVLHNTQILQGSLILAGVFHCLIGMTGLVGLLLRYVGPVTIVPAIFLIGIYLMKATAKFAKAHWGISFISHLLFCSSFYTPNTVYMIGNKLLKCLKPKV